MTVAEYAPPDVVTINAGKALGSSLAAELEKVGLLGLPFSWGDDGQIQFVEGALSAEQVATLNDVIAAHPVG